MFNHAKKQTFQLNFHINSSLFSLAVFATTAPQTLIKAQNRLRASINIRSMQITALLDGTNFISPSLFKDIL